LHAERFLQQTMMDTRLENVPVQVHSRTVARMEFACVELVATILATEPETLSYGWPLNWRQAFKERWFPGWAKRRWPVVYDHIEVTRMGLYPEIRWEGRRTQAIHFMQERRWSGPANDETKKEGA